MDKEERKTALAFFRYMMIKKRADVIALLFFRVVSLLFFLYFFREYYFFIRATFRLFTILISLFLIYQNKNASYKLLWLFLFMIFPLFSVLFYFISLLPQRVKKKTKNERINLKSTKTIEGYGEYTSLFKYLDKLGFSAFSNTSATYFHSGEEMIDALVKEIKKAKERIYLEYFIVEEGLVWDRILSALTERARYGVDIRIIIDDMGCFALHPKLYARQLLESGIKFSIFNPFRPFFSSYHNNRDHRKFAIIDGKVAFTGGVNLADEYINENCPYNYFKDCAIMLKGDAAKGIERLFLDNWESLQKGSENAEKSLVRETETEDKPSHDGFFAPFTDSPIEKDRVARNLYLRIIERAQNFVYISTPYLIPDDMIVEALEISAKSGVDVRIIVPYEPDKKSVKACTRSYYERLISAGVRIFEYEYGFNHAKLIYADTKVGIVGSTNLDYRSMYLNYEGGVLIYASSVLSEIDSDFSGMMLASCEIKKESLKKDLFSKLVNCILRLFSPLM